MSTAHDLPRLEYMQRAYSIMARAERLLLNCVGRLDDGEFVELTARDVWAGMEKLRASLLAADDHEDIAPALVLVEETSDRALEWLDLALHHK